MASDTTAVGTRSNAAGASLPPLPDVVLKAIGSVLAWPRVIPSAITWNAANEFEAAALETGRRWQDDQEYEDDGDCFSVDAREGDSQVEDEDDEKDKPERVAQLGVTLLGECEKS